ncbi:unnamed protein product [Allacma fusca]|uniref:Uncharacterized protein n=1 Tax=Allacma fusca TaxID=39272 RepID=A0A8J2P1K1_9HEXA|nr:unnamed protein product [Allacma fusca]
MLHRVTVQIREDLIEGDFERIGTLKVNLYRHQTTVFLWCPLANNSLGSQHEFDYFKNLKVVRVEVK